MHLIEFHTLFQRQGGYSLPVLIELKYPERESWYFTNNMENINYQDNEYIATTMEYRQPTSKDGILSGGSLEITIDETNVISSVRTEILKWFDTVDGEAELNCIAFINEGYITEIGQFKNQLGTVTVDGEKIVWNFGEVEKFQMQLNPVEFTPDALLY